MSINVDDIRRQIEIERVHHQEVAEEAAALPEIEDLSQEMEDRGEPDGEIEEARSEGLMQQIQNGEENREIYEGVTEERIRDVIEEIQGENHTVQDVRDAVAEGTRIDVADIPPGVTAEEFVDQYRRTGNLFTRPSSHRDSIVDTTPTTSVTVTNTSTGTTYVNMDSDSTGQTTTSIDASTLDAELGATIDRLVDSGEVVIDPEHGAEVNLPREEPDKPLTPKQIRAKQRKDNPERYAEDAKQVLMNKRVNNISNLDRKRETYLSKRNITSDDIAITMKGHLFHTTYATQVSFSSGQTESALLFDKNFNLLAPDGDGRRRRRGSVLSRRTTPRSQRVGVRINRKGFVHNARDTNPVVKKYLILDKQMLITSVGQQFKLKVKNNVKITELFTIKKKFQSALRSMHEAVDHIAAGVGAVLPPEDFEIIYELGSIEGGTNFITVLMRFHDVTITNSIERSKYLGDMIVRQTVEHYTTRNGNSRLNFRSSVEGQRMDYVSTDAIAGYVHSHLTSGVKQSFSGFCTGDQNYSLESPDTIDIEAHVHRLKEFVSWESLEGGPHYRMENVNPIGSVHNMRSSGNMKRLPSESYLTAVIEHIHNYHRGFSSLSNCFNMINKGGELIFTVDRRRFYLQVIEMFNKETLDNLHRRWLGNNKYFYKPDLNQFYKVVDRGISNPLQLRQQAIDYVMTSAPVYMNGRYIKPTVIEIADPFEGLQFCPSPELMYELVNVIMYHLTDKLEKHGNTSEVEEEG